MSGSSVDDGGKKTQEDKLLSYRRKCAETTEGTWQGGEQQGMNDVERDRRRDATAASAVTVQTGNNSRFHDSAQHGTWGNLSHLYPQQQHQQPHHSHDEHDEDIDDDFGDSSGDEGSDMGAGLSGKFSMASSSGKYGSGSGRSGFSGFSQQDGHGDSVASDLQTERRHNRGRQAHTGETGDAPSSSDRAENGGGPRPALKERSRKEIEHNLRDLMSSGIVNDENEDDDEEEFVYYDSAEARRRRQQGWRGLLTWDKARPTIRAILLTVALLLSSAAAMGCRFMTIDVGFVPNNLNLVSSTFEVGPWSYPPHISGEGDGKCLRYPDFFHKQYISNDSMWNLTQGSSVLVIVLGWVCLVITWMLATKRIKGQTLRYKAAVAFICGLMLIFECVTFAFLQVGLCNADVWETKSEVTGATVYKRARSCSISRDGILALVSVLIYFVLVVLLCKSRMREEMEHSMKTAGRKAAQLHYHSRHRRASNDYRGEYNRAYDDDDDDDDLDGLFGIGDHEKEADKELDVALSVLESKRFDNIASELDDSDDSTSTGAQSKYHVKNHESLGGLDYIAEGNENEESQDSDEMEDVPIDQPY